MAEASEQVSTNGLVDTKRQSGAPKRRQYSEALKRQMVAETLVPGASVSIGSRPSSWWRFGTAAEAPWMQRRRWKLSAAGTVAGSDRRHGGLFRGRSTAIKPCAFGAPLRGCGA